MKNVGALLAIAIATFMLTGCSHDQPTVERRGLTGFVVEADYEKKRLLVVESDETKQGEDYEAEWYTGNKDAVLLDSKSNPALFTDVEVGFKVETWATLPSVQTYPSSTDLSRFVIADDVKHPHTSMLQKTAIQTVVTVTYVKNQNPPGTIIIQNVSTNETEWIIQAYHYNQEKGYRLAVHAETAEVREIS